MSEQSQVDLDLGDEEEVVVDLEKTQAEEEQPAEAPVEAAEDQFEQAESATQKRINRLTKKMRESERQQEAALNYAQQVQQENEQLKSRLNTMDTNYVDEYAGRVESQIAQAESELAQAVELSDSAKVVEAQRKLTSLAIQADRAAQAKKQQEDRVAAQPETMQQPQYQQPQYQQQPQQARRPDPKAEEWAARNEWFGQDEAKTYAAFGIHKKLVEQEGFDPTSDEYYTELDRQIEETFPSVNNQEDSTRKRPAQTVAGATRTKKTGRSGKQVRLTPSEVAIAKKLGVPTAEYAKYVKR